MDSTWRNKELIIKAHFEIPEQYKLYCAGNAVDLIKDGVSSIEEIVDLERDELIEKFAEMKAPPGCQVCLFIDDKGNHIIVTPKVSLFAVASAGSLLMPYSKDSAKSAAERMVDMIPSANKDSQDETKF